jgi:hypothetical protein
MHLITFRFIANNKIHTTWFIQQVPNHKILTIRFTSQSQNLQDSQHNHKIHRFTRSHITMVEAPAHTPRRVDVTTLPKIIPYYHLNQCIWHLSNNPGLACHCCRVKPGEITYIETKDQTYALKLTRRQV